MSNRALKAAEDGAKGLVPGQRHMRAAGVVICLAVLSILCLLPPVASRAAEGRYVIGVEDILDIRVWENPNLSVIVPVRPDGKITVPLLGDVVAAGKEPLALKKDIEEGLASFIKKPVATVIIQSINSIKVYIVGPGVENRVLTLKRDITLMQMLSQLGPLAGADLSGAFVLRGGEKLKADLNAIYMKGDASHDVSFEPDDIVFIPDNFESRVQIVGAVKAPQTIRFREGLTLLDAVLVAGGLTEFADQKNIVIVRREHGGSKRIVAQYKEIVKNENPAGNVEIRPGDIIIVKEGLF